MRLFIAVDLDERTCRGAFALGEEVARRLQSAGAVDRKGVTWVAAKNLHLTLHFLGEVEAARAKPLIAQFEQAFGTRAFDLVLSGLGVFPPAGPPRVIWVGATSGAESLAALHREAESRLKLLGFEVESRPFQAHLTLGRFRKPAGPRVRDLVGQAATRDLGPSHVDRVTLYQSELSPQGPAYTSLVQAALSG